MLVSNTESKKRAELDRTLQGTKSMALVRRDPVTGPSGTKGRKVPAWWKGDAAAAASTIAAARDHGYVVGQTGG
jgi:hypothetical protein